MKSLTHRRVTFLVTALLLSPLVIGWIAYDAVRIEGSLFNKLHEFGVSLRTELHHLIDEWGSL